MTVTDILRRLIGFPSVVGRPNGDIAGWIADYLESHGAKVQLLTGPEGDRCNLFASLGPADVPGYIVSAHMDVVPAGEAGWSTDPFVLRADGDRLYGRGTSDMKGYIAAALAAVPTIASLKLARPVHFAFSYDEEAGCIGVPHLIARLPELCAAPLGAIIGEPSSLTAIRAHKGKAAARLTVTGRPGHSSRPDLGLNAIHAMADVLAVAVRTADSLTAGPLDEVFAPPYSSLQVGTIGGGRAVNIIPDSCVIDLEARAIAGVDPASLLAPVRAVAEGLVGRGYGAIWQTLSAYHALSLPADAPLVGLLEALTGRPSIAAVSYGTEAGLYQAAGIPAIICGPGDIDRAHKPDEYIRAGELSEAEAMIAALGRHCAL
ncbi:acetylornithine deacetylase [Oryzibacter oryziterrae]|uniref:acetylornithine deacetylase n=1 Tax=Oryzibacter oryziterrae TaxID=2766474 RepID=UPI001F0180AB|nr:acetylornithine deacetylase [Oryzibacter oryziterrae]